MGNKNEGFRVLRPARPGQGGPRCRPPCGSPRRPRPSCFSRCPSCCPSCPRCSCCPSRSCPPCCPCCPSCLPCCPPCRPCCARCPCLSRPCCCCPQEGAPRALHLHLRSCRRL